MPNNKNMREDISKPITKQQLDALERAADKLFKNLGIDIEFTRHFLDRVNDERNQKQITIQELAELLVKEYKRWGKHIAKMPFDAQAVMKDLSSAINIPFVLNKDGKEKDLVAKTVMRKKNFKTPNPELPVESAEYSSQKNMTKTSNPRMPQHVAHFFRRNGSGSIYNFDIYREKDGSLFYTLTNQMKMPIHPSSIDPWTQGYDNARKNVNTVIDAFERGGAKAALAQLEKVTRSKWKMGNTKSHSEETDTSSNTKLSEYELDQAPLDVKTPTPKEIADKHGVDLDFILSELKKGIKVELEHTTDMRVAAEIALDHLNEMPDYYRKLSKFDHEISEMLLRGSFECELLRERMVDPREAILRKALEHLDKMVKRYGDKHDIGSYAFDISRSFDLSGIATARDLVNLYRQWKKNDEQADLSLASKFKKASKNSKPNTLFNLGLAEDMKLDELFDRAYNYEWVTPVKDDKKRRTFWAKFQTDDGGLVKVSFNRLQPDGDNFEIIFSKNGEVKRTNEGDQFKIFSTVTTIIKEFVKNNPQIRLLMFTARRENEELESPLIKNKRASLYRQMLKRLADQLGFDFHEDVVGRMSEFYLVFLEKNNDVNENISITGTEKRKQEKKRKLQPGTEEWFKHWFSKVKMMPRK